MPPTNNEPVFGTGPAYPLGVDGLGRLKLSSEEDTLLDSVQAVLENAQGSAPMDPRWGHGIQPFTTLNDLTLEGHRIGDAILRSDSRIRSVDVEFLNGPSEGDVLIRIVILSASGQFSRTYPFFTLSSAE